MILKGHILTGKFDGSALGCLFLWEVWIVLRTSVGFVRPAKLGKSLLPKRWGGLTAHEIRSSPSNPGEGWAAAWGTCWVSSWSFATATSGSGFGPRAEVSKGKGDLRAPGRRTNQPIWKWRVHREQLLTLYFPIHIHSTTAFIFPSHVVMVSHWSLKSVTHITRRPGS